MMGNGKQFFRTVFRRLFAEVDVNFSDRQATDELFGHRIRDHQSTCWYDLLTVHGSVHRPRWRISGQPGLRHGLSILLVQHYGRTVGRLVQHQVFEQVEKRCDLWGVYRVQRMWFLRLFGVGLC